MQASAPKHILPSDIEAELLAVSELFEVPDWKFADWPYSCDALFEVVEELGKSDWVLSVKRNIAEEGYAVIDMRNMIEAFSESQAAAALTTFLNLFGRPLKVFRNHPFWRELTVDLSRPANKSCGCGHQAVHMDFVNASTPPDYVCLLCIRPDPYGGGASILAKIEGVELELSSRDRQVLSDSSFRDGVVEQLSGIGTDVNPFSVIDLSGSWRYRFTSNLLSSSCSDAHALALHALADVLKRRSLYVTLQKGDLLLINQHKAVHGRAAMGDGQERLDPSIRRLLLQSFLREKCRVSS